MISALWLAVSLLAQVALPINVQTAAEVAVLTPDRPTPITAVPAKSRTRNIRVIFIGVSSDSLTLDAERSALRLKDPSPRFQLTLPAGVDVDDVRLLRLKSKDGHRSVGYTSSLEHPFSKDDVVAFAIEAGDPAQPRTYRVKTTVPLKPGEYAFLIDTRFYDFGVN